MITTSLFFCYYIILTYFSLIRIFIILVYFFETVVYKLSLYGGASIPMNNYCYLKSGSVFLCTFIYEQKYKRRYSIVVGTCYVGLHPKIDRAVCGDRHVI